MIIIIFSFFFFFFFLCLLRFRVKETVPRSAGAGYVTEAAEPRRICKPLVFVRPSHAVRADLLGALRQPRNLTHPPDRRSLL